MEDKRHSMPFFQAHMSSIEDRTFNEDQPQEGFIQRKNKKNHCNDATCPTPISLTR